MKTIIEKEMRRKRKDFKRIFMALTFIVGIILFSGCSKEEVNKVEENDLVPLQIGGVSLNIDEGKMVSSWTKSGEWNWSGKSIGVFRRRSSGYYGTADNIKYSAGNSAGSSWNPSDSRKQIYLMKSPAKLRAYYPYDNSVGSDGIVTLTSQLYSEDRDMCCQKSDISSAGGLPVSFTLGHVYSRFVFNFTRGTFYDGICAISRIKIENPGIISSDTYNLLTDKSGTPSAGNKGEVTINDVGITGISAGNSSTVYVLMVPSETALSGSLKFTFTVDGKDITGTVEDASTVGLLTGTQYMFDITINSSAVEVKNTANCYMIAPGNSLIIPVNVKGNGDANAVAGTGIDVHHTAASVGILWETSPDLISLSGFTTGNQAVGITANDDSKTGNAVIAAYSGADQSGDILWSWHIWVSDYDPDKGGETYTVVNSVNASYVFMDRNLGAVSAIPGDEGTIGLLYQWGRKDPFTAASILNPQIDPNIANEITVYNSNGTGFKLNDKKRTVSVPNNLLNSIKNPDILYVGTSSSSYDWYTASDSFHNNYLWGGASTVAPDGKTVFDPCPAGWRVPAQNGDSSPWSGFSKSTFALSDYGRVYAGSYYPSTGCRYGHNGELYSTGASGSYWSANTGPDYGYRFLFDKSEVYPLYNSDRAGGLSVRCVKE